MPTFHKGSWGGLPDFGITEAIQRRVAPQRTLASSGGSNLIGSQQAAPRTTPSVQGAFIGPQKVAGPQYPSTGSSGVSRPPSGGGGGGDNTQQRGSNDLLENVPEQPPIDFDALIAPQLQALDEAETAISSATQNRIGEAEARRGTQTAQTQQSIAEQEGILGRKKTTQTQMGESAADEARRQFAEIQQGLQSLYGGTTGTGAFATELAGRGAMGQIFQIRQNLSNVIAEADDKLLQIKKVGELAQKEIEQNTNAEISQLRDQLQLGLGEIRREKGQLQTWKAQAAAEAIQQYQNMASQIRARNTQFLQDLYAKQVDAENQLKLKLTSARQTQESFKVMDLQQPGQESPVSVRYGSRGTIQDLNRQPISPESGSRLYSIGKDDDENGGGIPPGLE